MRKKFNVTGVCNPKLHYMVNIDKNLQQMKDMIEEGDYFVINRARQYGKTTTLCMLDNFLCGEYLVVHLDFQMLGDEDFASETAFVTVFMRELLDNARDDIPEKILEKLEF